MIVLFMTFYVQKSDIKVRSKLKSTLFLHYIWHIKKKKIYGNINLISNN